jgi:hypothetical protein
MSELRSCIDIEGLQALGLQARQELVQRVDEHGERKIMFLFGRGPRQNDVSAGLGSTGELSQQTRLADAGFAHELDRRRAALVEVVEERVDRPQLTGAPDEQIFNQSQCLTLDREETGSERATLLTNPFPVVRRRRRRTELPRGCPEISLRADRETEPMVPSGAGPWTRVRDGPEAGREVQGDAQGGAPMSGRTRHGQAPGMTRYLIRNRHDPDECGAVFASFKGHGSPLRHRATLASCRQGGHEIWWTVDAESDENALRLLPPYVVERSTITRVSEVQIP